jgi:hypothetical protein
MYDHRLFISCTIVTGMAAAGCQAKAPKAPLSDDFSSLTGDGKADSPSWLLELGTLKNGQTSEPVAYTSSPPYRGFTFTGSTGDAIDVWVRSEDGDAVAWLLDQNFNVIASNDDAEGTLDSHVTATLTGATNATFHIVFREYDDHDATFRVTLIGSSDGMGPGGTNPGDPFDPASCAGPTLTTEQAVAYLDVPNGVVSANIGNYKAVMRQRACYPGFPCADWTPAQPKTPFIDGRGADLSIRAPALTLDGSIAVQYDNNAVDLGLLGNAFDWNYNNDPPSVGTRHDGEFAVWSWNFASGPLPEPTICQAPMFIGGQLANFQSAVATGSCIRIATDVMVNRVDTAHNAYVLESQLVLYGSYGS